MNQEDKKRIDVVSRYFYPVAAGIENNIMRTYAPMLGRGWDVTVHTSRDTYTQKNVLAARAEADGIKIERYRRIPLFGFWPRFDRRPGAVLCLHNFDVMPHFFIMLYALSLKIAGKKDFTLIVVPHGGFSPEWPLFKLPARIIKWIYHRTVGVLLLNLAVDGIRAVAFWEKEEMAAAGVKADKIEVITNGLEAEAYADVAALASGRARKNAEEFGDYIIQGGRVSAIKNQLAAIKALSLIKSGLKLVLIGPCQDKAYRAKLDKAIKALDLKDRVVFLGVVRGIDKYYYLKQAKAMVHMSLWEGNCNFINEAWSQGLTCVVADSKGLNEQIRDGENGYLSNPHDHEKLAEKIIAAVAGHDSAKQARMRRKNLEYVADNSWEKVSGRVEGFYLRRAKAI